MWTNVAVIIHMCQMEAIHEFVFGASVVSFLVSLRSIWFSSQASSSAQFHILTDISLLSERKFLSVLCSLYDWGTVPSPANLHCKPEESWEKVFPKGMSARTFQHLLNIRNWSLNLSWTCSWSMCFVPYPLVKMGQWAQINRACRCNPRF